MFSFLKCLLPRNHYFPKDSLHLDVDYLLNSSMKVLWIWEDEAYKIIPCKSRSLTEVHISKAKNESIQWELAHGLLYRTIY